IGSFITNPDKNKIIFSNTSVYNGSSNPAEYTKNIQFSLGRTVSNTVTLAAGVNTQSQFTLNLDGKIPPNFGGSGGFNTTFGMNLSVTFAQTVIESALNLIVNEIKLTVPPNKKLFVYV